MGFAQMAGDTKPTGAWGPAEAPCPGPQVPSQCFTLSLENTLCLAGSRRRLWQPQLKEHTIPTRVCSLETTQ